MTVLESFQLLIDFGLVVLIWMVQLLIYPSFLFYSREQLIKWHHVYTQRLSFIVIPLMFSQLFLTVYLFFIGISMSSSINLVVVLLLWASTFSMFVPIHSNISKGNSNPEMLNRLVSINWFRTILWTLLFLYNSRCFF
ncbi:hypothetical protein [Tenacibaculum sp. M341]|uniref:hypothetical protein n=1 Tax=Tenacibaculum sp. M341 TaxID=2530339 RepID=UPI0010498302|nr:hypothetical protein [Tenacibaculum sp. M341]TCI85057.1 hypothetical protein EYW44_18725 [Tenacibaculum sp. M341]